jgi:hypothetical protein
MPDSLKSTAKSASPPALERPGLPVLPPRNAVVEILVLLALPAALDYWVPAFPSLAEMHPHPFWLPVLLLSLQYGSVSGLLAAGVAIALSALLGWPEQEVGENHFNYLLRIWAQPVLWLVAALVLGQFRMRQIEEKQELRRHLGELSSQRTAIADYAGNLRERCEALERQLAVRIEPEARALLLALAALRNREADGRQAALRRALELSFGACQASLAVKEADGLRVVVRHGWQAGAPWSERIGAGHALHQAIAVEGRPVTVMVPGEEIDLGGEGLAAVPIYSSLGDRVLGMLKLESAPSEEIEASTLDRLAVIAAPLSSALEPRAGGFQSPTHAVKREGLGKERVWRQLHWQGRRDQRGEAGVRRKPTRVK